MSIMRLFAFGGFLLCLCPSVTCAQSAFAGLVTDASGAVLPGVTVEAASPALIEKVRAAVTDGEGRYTIAGLRPGTYAVTFALVGFAAIKRDGIDLPASFTATVNAELRIGAVEETIVVTGQSPTVDVRNVQRTEVLKREFIDALPIGRGYRSVGLVLPAVTGGGLNRPMVGDQSVPPTLATQGGTSFDMTQQIDGVLVTTLHSSTYQPYNDAMIQESTYQTSALSAEVSRGGVRVNLIGRDGGNTFFGGQILNFANGTWQAKNITPALVARNLRTPNRLAHTLDFNPWVSGPIKQNTLWFFASFRYQELQQYPASTAQGGGYGTLGGHILNDTGRVTWQVAPSHKISAYAEYIGRPQPINAVGDPGGNLRKDSKYRLAMAKWSSPMTNRLLLDAGVSWNGMGYSKSYLNGEPERGTPLWYASASRLDIGTGINKVAGPAGIGYFYPRMFSVMASASYVTGSHNIKFGVQDSFGTIQDVASWNADLYQIYVNGVPSFVDILNSPTVSHNSVSADLGLYAQDSWTLNRLTVTGGLRYDYFNASIDATSSPAGRFMPARTFAAVNNLPKFANVAPRVGAAYDVFGDGRTAIKASVSKYLAGMGLGNIGGTRNYDPTAPVASSAGAAPTPDRRDWRDLNRDDIAQDNEIGPSNNLNYGLTAPKRLDPNVEREYSIEYSASVQHEFVQGYSASLIYMRRPYRNSFASKNTLVDPSDYAGFQVASPLNNGEMITVYNLNSSKQGKVAVLDTSSAINTRTYSGIHLMFNGRLPRGGSLLGGWSMERNATVTCDTSDPNLLRFCDQNGALHQENGKVPSAPFRPSYRLLGTFPGLPYALAASLVIRGFSGDPLVNNWVVPAAFFPNGRRTQPVTVPLIAPQTQFLPNWNQVDVSAKRTFRFGRKTLVADVTLFNLLNASTVITQTTTFGASFGTPTLIIPGRLPRVGLQLGF